MAGAREGSKSKPERALPQRIPRLLAALPQARFGERNQCSASVAWTLPGQKAHRLRQNRQCGLEGAMGTFDRLGRKRRVRYPAGSYTRAFVRFHLLPAGAHQLHEVRHLYQDLTCLDRVDLRENATTIPSHK